MDKEQKAAQIDEIAERLGDANAIFAVDYRGISVPQAAELRSKLSEANATFRVVKNRLAKRAAERAGTAELEEFFEGPVALTFVKGDAVTAAKAIATFGRQNEILEYKGGLMDGEPLEPEQFQAIARLPSLDVLHGRLVAMTASPLTGRWRRPRTRRSRSRARPSRRSPRRRPRARTRSHRLQRKPKAKIPPRKPPARPRAPRERARRNKCQPRRCPQRIGSRSSRAS